MNRPSGVGGQSHFASAMSRSESRNNNQTITLTQGLRDRSVNEAPAKPLSQRTVAKAEPTSYLSWLSDSVKEVGRAAALFSSDLANTTYKTFSEGWSSMGQGVSEASKFSIGTLGLAASLAQAGLAAAGEFADTKGMTIPDSKVDMIGWALAKAGIKTVGVPKSELRQLGMSLAKLHLGQQQDIHITQGKLQLKSDSDSSAGLRWARNYRPETGQTTTQPSQTEEKTASSGEEPSGESTIITISNIHLKEIQSGVVQSGDVDTKGNARETLTIKANRLSFDVEYNPPCSAEGSQEPPVTISVDINEPELIGESNLLSLVATSVNRYCSGLTEHLANTLVLDNSKALPEPGVWNQEETGVQLNAQSAHIKIKNVNSLLPSMSGYIPEVTELSLIDLNAGLYQNLIGNQTSKPNIFFNNLEFGDNQSGPFHISTGQMKLDQDLNGSLDIMVQTPFSKLEEFMEEVPKLAKEKVTRNMAGNNRLGIMIHLDITRGDIDLNTLTALGVSEETLPFLQTQIEKGVLRALKSEHTRFRNLPKGGKEFKLDSAAISNNVPKPLSKKLHGMLSKKTASYYDLGDKPYIKTSPKGRGKISLTELLQLEIEPGSKPTQRR